MLAATSIAKSCHARKTAIMATAATRPTCVSGSCQVPKRPVQRQGLDRLGRLAGHAEVAADAVDRPGPQADAGDAVVEVVDAGVALSFDRYGASSQFVQLAGVQDSKNHIVGLTLSETEPTGNRRRLFLGHDKEGVASVSLMDRNGRKRIVLQVTPDGTPSISFLDADGKVVNQLGPTRVQ